MFYVNVHIDLPSERALRQRTLRDWLSQLVGREVDLSSGEDVATVSGLSVFKHVVDGLERLGITDVLSLIVDGKTAYVDTDENSGDLETAVSELDARAALESSFESMRLVLSHHHEGLRTLIELALRRRVPANTPELVVQIAARLDDMQIRPGETPAMYAERLRAIAADTDTLSAARTRFAGLAKQIQHALGEELGELCVSSTVSPVRLRLIRPGPRQLDHFRRLSWGPMVRMPKYRPVPISNRTGAYDEPFYHYYYDPYFDFVAWVTLTEIVAGRGWQGLDFEVVDSDARHLFGSQDAQGQLALGGEYEGISDAGELVRIAGTTLVVNPIVPTFSGPDPGEIGDPRVTPGFAGEGRTHGPAHAGWNEGPAGVEGGDLGGSCGASCGGCGSG
jgi:hypothetical protein